MSDALIASLQSRITALESEKAALASEAKDRRIAGKKLKGDFDALKAAHDAAVTERDGLKTKADAKPSELQTQVDTLQAQLRSRDHRDAFGSVKEFTAKVKDKDGKETDTPYTVRAGVSTEALWTNLQYKPEGDTPDAAKITGLLGAAVVTHPYLFEPRTAETVTTGPRGSQQPIVTPRRDAGPGAGKGVTDTASKPDVLGAIQTAYAATGRTIPGRV